MSRHGTGPAARAMDAQDREKDVIAIIAIHLADNPLPNPIDQLEALLVLRSLDRRR